jgi:aminopeptidase N
VQRIKDVTRLRTAQFAEDAGPLAHPIRPESYVEMSNFYTATVYEKGAEVVRLYQTLLGRKGFRAGLRHYLARHDGCAVTCDDFRQAMAEANGVDLDQFERWYLQAGTPVVRAHGVWDEVASVYTLTLTQSQRVFLEQPSPKPLPIPLRVGLLGADGKDIPGTARTLDLIEAEQTFAFQNVPERPVASIGRGFSAPVKLEVERNHEELAFLMAHDSDSFNRWEAGQELSKRVLLGLVNRVLQDQLLELDQGLVHAFRKVLSDSSLDGSIKSLTLTLPSEELLAQELDVVDPDAVHRARRFAVRTIAAELRGELMHTYAENAHGSDAIDKLEVDRRRLKNRALHYLVALEEPKTLAMAAQQFRTATVMTDYEAAFMSLVDLVSAQTNRAIDEFYERWRNDPLVLDKWFRIQAMSSAPASFDRVVALSQHEDFHLTNPNRARSLLYSFAAGNPSGFHRADGGAYRFIADQILKLDALNPQVAARIVSSFNQWKRYEPGRRSLMKSELERIASWPTLSKDVAEIVERALTGGATP